LQDQPGTDQQSSDEPDPNDEPGTADEMDVEPPAIEQALSAVETLAGTVAQMAGTVAHLADTVADQADPPMTEDEVKFSVCLCSLNF